MGSRVGNLVVGCEVSAVVGCVLRYAGAGVSGVVMACVGRADGIRVGLSVG